jgi:hypothetical protein
MINAEVLVRTASTARQVSLASYLTPALEEAAHERAYAWIKSLRRLEVDGAPFRERFTMRGDSLWWFTEIYLHREQVVLDIHRALAALDRLITAEGPIALDVTSGSQVVRYLAPVVGSSRGLTEGAPLPARTWWRRLARLDLRARSLNVAALLAAERYRGVPKHVGRVTVAAFIHRAFWRAGGEDGSAESYIGPVLEELEGRLEAGDIRYVGIGPSRNFRSARQWTLAESGGSPLLPVERYAPVSTLRASRSIWRRRFTHFATLCKSPALRNAASIDGIDCWPLIREQLAGVAWLQWPWSIRAMDEAAAALDVLQPSGVLTYAEAGGWGRALILEARRRHVPSVGLQHGFIYRHWLNYRHEPDEMQCGTMTPAFPNPTRTLLFDTYAQRHLEQRGRFPQDALQVTGSPRLDVLRRTVEDLRRDGPANARRALGLKDSDALVLITTKEKEARGVLASFCAAAACVPGIAIVIKPHPAENAAAYAEVIQAVPVVRVSPPGTTLAELLAHARMVVTVNSTVALDAAAFDIPALVIGLPNNLSPFVQAGAFAGAADPARVEGVLGRILYDEGFRQQLAERCRAVFGDLTAQGPGRASAASADAVLTLVHSGGAEAGSG